MKKKAVLFMMTCLVTAAALGGCGKKKGEDDWIAEHGIVVSPLGDCQVTMGGYDSESGEIKGDFTADVNVTVSESTEGAADGFKKVSALFTIDAADCTGDGILFWCSAFDRYTGTSFEFDNTVNYQLQGEHTTPDGFITIKREDAYYDVAVEFETENEGTLIYKTITVTCPEDYDGTVFQIGKDSLEQMTQNSEIDYAARLYTIEELPYYGDGYCYFTVTAE